MYTKMSYVNVNYKSAANREGGASKLEAPPLSMLIIIRMKPRPLSMLIIIEPRMRPLSMSMTIRRD